jgi:glycosyltransferase involved in cell wall biosynthesis
MIVDTPLTIAYFTCRNDPKIEWFFRSLNRELHGDWTNVHILIIDFIYQFEPEQRLQYYKDVYSQYTNNVQVVSPKPSPWQGKYKVTKNEYFAASNARNTAFAYCKTDYIACIDDLTVVKEGWLEIVLWGQKNKSVVLGSYAKVKQLECKEDGTYTFDAKSIESGLDSRFKNSAVTNPKITRVAGSWLFGCSFALPIEYTVKVDGFDEACDGQGAEDYDFGIRLGRVTHEIYYSRQMFTYEDDDLHFAPGNQKFIRESKVLTDKTSMKQKIGVSSDHAMLQNVLHSFSCLPFIPTKLSLLRQNCPMFPETFTGVTDWRDGKPLYEM